VVAHHHLEARVDDPVRGNRRFKARALSISGHPVNNGLAVAAIANFHTLLKALIVQYESWRSAASL